MKRRGFPSHVSPSTSNHHQHANTSQNVGTSNDDWKTVQYKRGAHSNQGRRNYAKKTIEIKTEKKQTSFSIRCLTLNFGVWNKDPLQCGNCADLEFIAYEQKLKKKRIRLEINTYHRYLQIVIFQSDTQYFKLSFPFSGISREQCISFYHKNEKRYICIHSKLSPLLTDHSANASPLTSTPSKPISNRNISRICANSSPIFYKVGKAFCFLMELDKQDQGFSEVIPRIYDCHKQLSTFLKQSTSELRLSAGRTGLITDQESKDVCLMKKILITPTKVYYLLPELDTTNRVIRHFWENRDSFFRVAFLDDDMAKLYSAKFKNLDSRLQKFLDKGLSMFGYDLKFLGFSAAQLRSASTWFYLQKSSKPTTKDIREYMGDFSEIKNVAKHAARVGQCFSATYPSFEVSDDEYLVIEDITAEKYIFSDGVGKISEEFANKIHEIRKSTEVRPSAFQIRFAGFKGVVSVDPTLTKHQMVLRKSQLKFPSQQKILEIVQEAKRNMGYLNRQFITILSALGIRDEIFLKYQRDMLNRIKVVNENPKEAHALVSLSHSHLKSYICTCLRNGISTKEPFLQQLLYCFRHRAIKELETKSKIYVQKSACLVGIMDEYGILKENEIFVNLSPSYGNPEYGVVKGTCIVSKNPCFHPGDIRKVEAVDYPELQHLHDVLVFPQKGERPISSMISGSDLDGDVFFISWEPDLIFPMENQTPMSFEKEEEPQRENNVTETDIINFLMEYFTRDNLGIIANLHLAQSDLQEKSIFSDICLRLCELHSIAVDSAKTGKFADIDSKVSISAYPHFMQHVTKKAYKSKKILGRLYDDLKEKIKEKDFFKRELNNSNVYDPDFCFEGFEMFVDKVLGLYNEYEFLITSDMKKFGVETEAELVSGWITGQVKTYGSKQRDVEEGISRNMVYYWKHFRKKFDKMVTEASSDPNAKYKIASAWYFVAYKKSDSRLLSFAWINFMELVEIFNLKKQAKSTAEFEHWEDSDDEDLGEYGDDVLDDMFSDAGLDDFNSDVTDCISDVGDFSQLCSSSDSEWGDPSSPEFYN
ncbi:hypothetical protein C9374_007742 [Naegleria lovaniensis]|uniref:RNA-dependent RNA polymerase n=1 Tax=Naegleria lovaniensis TaxID=51637 RepID=A0AA88GGQ4_NAELO|nr:uncharacterized protein C9374_007742 [Naegleria lovaniensis]KAG2379104.1 hypothetical protein C9374_007742 [Naegleria lovaniensis]